MSRFVERAAWFLLCLFIFSMPWEKSVWVPGVGTITRLLGIVAFVAGAFAAARRRSVRPPNALLALAALFVAWSWLTYLWSLDPRSTLIRAGTFAELWAMMWLVWDQCRTAARQLQAMRAYVAGAVVASCIAFVRYGHHQQTYWRRYAAAGFDPNDFGLILALSVPLALYLALRARNWTAWLWRLATAVALAAIFLTASRTALVATFVAFGFALWTWRVADAPQRIASVLLVAALAVSIVGFAPAAQRTRLASLPGELGKGTFHGRSQIWKAGLNVFRHHLLLGVGSGAYPEAVRPRLGVPSVPGMQYVAHNTFLSVLVEAGIAGFCIFALVLAALCIFIWQMAWPERALWAVMLAVWLVGVSTLTWEHYKPTWLMMALTATEWARSYWPAPKRT